MYDIELTIKTKDWIYILLLGIVLGLLFSASGYILLNLNWVDGALYGILLGFSITLYSLGFITSMNSTILPEMPQKYWVPVAMFFSFVSGFLGTQMSIYIALFLKIELIEFFERNILTVSTFIGFLTYLVGALLYQFVKMRNTKERVDHEYVQSRLKSLETQLNPHFLFNALNSVAELIHQDKNKAEKALLRLSSFLRNTMNEMPVVSLQNELKNVEDYVALENIRFNDKISLHISGQRALQVPKFSIQLIVENAIKHGLQNKKELNIFINIDKDASSVTIKNDGLPIKEKQFGIGLSNLEQRLKLLQNGSLHIADEQNPTYIILIGE